MLVANSPKQTVLGGFQKSVYCTICSRLTLLQSGAGNGEKKSESPSWMSKSLNYLRLCRGEGLRQKPSWSSAPSSLRSDSGLVSSGLGSRRGHHGRRQGNRLRREKDRSGLGWEEKGEEDTRSVKKRGREGVRKSEFIRIKWDTFGCYWSDETLVSSVWTTFLASFKAVYMCQRHWINYQHSK